MLNRARIAVFVSGGGTNLQALLDAQKNGAIPHGEIALVVSSQAGAYALERAKNAGVPAQTVPSSLVLTGIVVSVSVTAIMLALTMRLYRRYRTLDIEEIAEKVREEGK